MGLGAKVSMSLDQVVFTTFTHLKKVDIEDQVWYANKSKVKVSKLRSTRSKSRDSRHRKKVREVKVEI